MKNSQLRLIASILLIQTNICVYADPTHKTVREDRVWVYESVLYGSHLKSYMKFDGTKNFNDTVYHRFHTFKTESWNDYDTDTITNHSPQEKEYFLREDEHKLWLRVNRSWMNVPDSFTDSEILLYDFGCKDGETLKLYPRTDNLYESHNIIIKTESPVIVDEEECAVMWSEDLGMTQKSMVIYMIEGIGPSIHGTLANYCLWYKSDNGHTPGGELTATLPDANLVCVYDKNGNIVYDSKNGPNARDTAVDGIPAKRHSAIHYDGKSLTADRHDDASITLFLLDVSGKVMSSISGIGNISYVNSYRLSRCLHSCGGDRRHTCRTA